MGFAPTARNSKPTVERFSSHQTKTVAAMARTKPRWSRYWVPKICGYTAVGSRIGEMGLDSPGRWNAGVFNRYRRKYNAM
ncbi:hypothetical protein D9M72_537580 [compost metagenome]